MAIIAATTFRGVELPEAYLCLARLELRKSEAVINAEFQLHATNEKCGVLDNVTLSVDYVPEENLFLTTFNALKTKYPDYKDC